MCVCVCVSARQVREPKGCILVCEQVFGESDEQ